MASSSSAPTTLRSKRNWYIHLTYTRHDYATCLRIIEEELSSCGGLAEYAIYVKALIMRHQGKISTSLQFFQAATCLSPHNVCNLKQVARSLYLLGKHRAAIDVYDETVKVGFDDWEIWHNKGLCYMYLKEYAQAVECFERGNDVQRHDATYMMLGKVFMLQENYKGALKILMEAADFSPQNSEILTTLGLLYLRLGENQKAFEHLGNSLANDPLDPKTILAAGSIIQDNQDMDVALVKYRIAAVKTPNSAQLWNNIGMCFYGKSPQPRYIAAVACLKRALYLDPFEWIISYNLGLVHLNKEQYASAFHFFSASINLKADVAPSYMYLAVTLARLDDFDNACSAYDKSIALDSNDYTTRLNYAITLYSNDEYERSDSQFKVFESLIEGKIKEGEEVDEEIVVQRALLGVALRKELE
jgi:Bardet-Biedl syndrome 4 protein